MRISARLEFAAGAGLAFVLLAQGGCRDEEPGEAAREDPSGDETTGGQAQGSSGTTGEPEAQPGADVCLSAAPLTPGSYEGNLRGKNSSGGACGRGGPDVFFRVDVSQRSDVRVQALGDGFDARVGVYGNDCAAPFDEFGLLCVEGVAGWVTDVAAGTELYIAVGARDADVEASPTGAFRLDVQTRTVLSAGERCGNPVWGRCEGGTRCAAPEDGGSEVCVDIPGDRCGNALPLALRSGPTVVSIEPDVDHTDAHRHACGGERSRERVFRVELPASGSDTSRLEVTGENVLALAARAPTCLAEQEAACSADARGMPAFDLDGPLPEVVYLFVELPAFDPEVSEQSPSLVRLDLSMD